MMPSPTEALRARSYKTAADYCAYPVASMESEDLHLPDKLPPGVSL
ncbi:hypothetical protein [Halomonas nitroreducens]|nr:hypothetical protein [Halomonas nitroreducens]